MPNTESILNTFTCVRQAREFIKEHKPLIDAIFAHQGKEERLTVRLVGEELMGKEEYHRKATLWNGEDASWRISEASTLTRQLTEIFRKMCSYGVLTRHEDRDMEHPVEIEDEIGHYEDKSGNILPDMVEVSYRQGQTITIPAWDVPGAHYVFKSGTRTIYPKYSYYTFN